MSTLLIVGGIGLLRLRAWARWLCLGYGVCELIRIIGFTIYTIMVVNPAMMQAPAEFNEKLSRKTKGPPMPMIFSENMFDIMAIAAAFFWLILFLIPMLIVLSLPRVPRCLYPGRGQGSGVKGQLRRDPQPLTPAFSGGLAVMKRERPAAVLVLAVLTIVAGCWGIITVFLSLVEALSNRTFILRTMVSSWEYDELMAFLHRVISGYEFFDLGYPVAVLVLAAVFLVAGTGLLQMRRWARITTMVAAILSLVLQLGVLLFLVGFVLPALRDSQYDGSSLEKFRGGHPLAVDERAGVGPSCPGGPGRAVRAGGRQRLRGWGPAPGHGRVSPGGSRKIRVGLQDLTL